MKLAIGGEAGYCYTHYRDIDPGRESVLFVHGAGMDHTVWTSFARHFARRSRNVVAVDLPGHGRSAGDPAQSIGALADWVAALLDALGIERTAVVGHSMGGLVALDFAARYPERARAVALVGSTAPMPVSDAILEAAAADDHAAFDMLAQWGYSKRHLYGGNSNPGLWMVGGTLRLFERCAPGVLHADMSACNSYAEGLDRAAAVRCPTMLVLGRDDRLTPVKATRDLVAALPSPDVRIIEEAGHTLMVEAPNALLDALRALL